MLFHCESYTNIITDEITDSDEATELLKELFANVERTARSKLETATLLIEHGADTNAIYDNTGQSLLHLTTQSVECIEVRRLSKQEKTQILIEQTFYFTS